MAQPKIEGIDGAHYTERRKKKEEWLRKRKGVLGASQAAAAVGLSKFRSPWSVWHDKMSADLNAEDIQVDKHANRAIEIGNRVEPIIRSWAREDLGDIFNPGRYRMQRHAKYRFIAATLDGWIHEPNDYVMSLFEGFPKHLFDKVSGRGVLEIKSAGNKSDWGDQMEQYPIDYMCQVQHSLSVTGYSWGILACLLGGGHGGLEIRYFPFVRVDEFCKLLLEKEIEFWQEFVMKRIPPPISKDNLPSQVEAMRERFASELAGKVVGLEPEYDGIDEVMQAAKALRRKADQTEKFCKLALMNRLGDAELAVLGNGSAYSFRTQQVKEHLVKEHTKRPLLRTTSKLRIEAAHKLLEATNGEPTTDTNAPGE
jgi:putative phage-type endonuclease